jgi:RES domain-containing protein
MNLWRIAAETRRYAAIDLSGKGAALRPGRWNDDGQLVVYTALTPALAVLETVAGGVRTPDLGGSASTTAFTDAVVERVRTKIDVWAALGTR